MKFFKDLFNKEEEAQMNEVENKQDVKEKREKRKEQDNKKQENTAIKYKKKEKAPLRVNDPSAFENKNEDHTVTKSKVDGEYKVQWKKPKAKKSFTKKEQDDDIEQLFGVEVKDVKIGDITTGQVLADTKEGYILSIEDTYIEALMPKEEYANCIEVGEQIKVVIYRLYDGVYYASNRRLDTIDKINDITKLMEADQAVSATVIGFKRNFFDVKIDGKIDGQVYAGNIDTKFVNEENANEYIGNTYDFAIIKKLNSKKYKFELSRTKLIKLAQKQVLANIEVGEEITATNLKLNKGGIEFDFNGVRGFVPLREISNTYINGIEDVENHIDLNEDVQVQIIEIKKQRGNVQLLSSIKSLKPSPWNDFIEKYETENILNATIDEIRPYGFMVKLDCDIKALLHKNNMSTEMGAEFKNYNVGDTFDVKIEDIDFDKNRVNITTSL